MLYLSLHFLPITFSLHEAASAQLQCSRSGVGKPGNEASWSRDIVNTYKVGSASVYGLAVVRFAVFLLAVTVRQASQKDMPEREEASELQEIFPRTFCSMVKPASHGL